VTPLSSLEIVIPLHFQQWTLVNRKLVVLQITARGLNLVSSEISDLLLFVSYLWK